MDKMLIELIEQLNLYDKTQWIEMQIRGEYLCSSIIPTRSKKPSKVDSLLQGETETGICLNAINLIELISLLLPQTMVNVSQDLIGLREKADHLVDLLKTSQWANSLLPEVRLIEGKITLGKFQEAISELTHILKIMTISEIRTVIRTFTQKTYQLTLKCFHKRVTSTVTAPGIVSTSLPRSWLQSSKAATSSLPKYKK
jgi:hypothetical protein